MMGTTPLLSAFLWLVFLHTEVISMSTTTSKHVLYDAPVSNNGARCRVVVYKKGLDMSEVSIVSPTSIGGLQSDEYLALNPQGKMPTLACTESGLSIPESDTICRYLLSTYADVGPSFQPDNCQSNILCRFHDLYLTTIQGCMYKANPPFGVFGTRKTALIEFCKQLGVINDMVVDGGDYLCGSEVSLADATLFPTMVFAKHMLPKFGYENPLPAKIDAWFDHVLKHDAVFKKVFDEIHSGLNGWEERKRWDTIWLAGVRDDAPGTIFDKIIAGDIPSDVVKQDDVIFAFKDVNPAAPAHVLVIPKQRSGLTNIRKASPEHVEILGRLMVAAGEIANDASLGFGDGARIVVNDGPDGGQEVSHLHLHVLGGRKMTWPPG